MLMRAAGIVALLSMSWACASTGGVPKPFPSPPVVPGVPATGLNTSALIVTALDLRGIRYRNGGSDPRGFDCSGFTQYVFAQYDVRLPREVRDQYRMGQPVRRGDLRPGDLLFFSTTAPGASHVAIAVGRDEFVHAPSSTGVVRTERLTSSYWSPRFLGAKRVG
jgi:cell wall-associated NlpC family hydrolase